MNKYFLFFYTFFSFAAESKHNVPGIAVSFYEFYQEEPSQQVYACVRFFQTCMVEQEVRAQEIREENQRKKRVNELLDQLLFF